MKYKLYILILFAIIFLPLSTAAIEESRPEIYFEEINYDAGKVMAGTVIDHTFTVYNRGGETLNIKAVRPGWSCSVAGFDRAILPGGEGKINVKLNTAKLEGRRKKYIRVFSDDPIKKVAYISIQANITPPIRVNPGSVDLRGLSSQVKPKEVYITGNLEEPLKIEAGSFSLKGKVKYEIETVKEGKQYIVRFENIQGVIGSYRGYLSLKTNYPEKPGIKIRISGSFN